VAETLPIARSPITQAPPFATVAAWSVSAKRSTSPLRLIDCTPCQKVLLRTATNTAVARSLGVSHGRVKRDDSGVLVAGVGPEEWIVIGPPGAPLPSAIMQTSDGGTPSTVIDLTHARALIRIVGADSARVLSKLCGINFGDTTTPNDIALRTSVARLVAEVIRNDLAESSAVATDRTELARSYLIMCERSAGQYLFDALLDAGQEFGIDIEGFAASGSIHNRGASVTSFRTILPVQG
jgi:heterotetrameric sarcosine oxidase gamma subunit